MVFFWMPHLQTKLVELMEMECTLLMFLTKVMDIQVVTLCFSVMLILVILRYDICIPFAL